jgi:hypothetical protein
MHSATPVMSRKVNRSSSRQRALEAKIGADSSVTSSVEPRNDRASDTDCVQGNPSLTATQESSLSFNSDSGSVAKGLQPPPTDSCQATTSQQLIEMLKHSVKRVVCWMTGITFRKIHPDNRDRFERSFTDSFSDRSPRIEEFITPSETAVIPRKVSRSFGRQSVLEAAIGPNASVTSSTALLTDKSGSDSDSVQGYPTTKEQSLSPPADPVRGANLSQGPQPQISRVDSSTQTEGYEAPAPQLSPVSAPGPESPPDRAGLAQTLAPVSTPKQSGVSRPASPRTPKTDETTLLYIKRASVIK